MVSCCIEATTVDPTAKDAANVLATPIWKNVPPTETISTGCMELAVKIPVTVYSAQDPVPPISPA